MSVKGSRKRKYYSRRIAEKSEAHVRVALVGQPNVGKSVIFNHWTGLGAIVSNYPGTTVEILEGTVFLPRQEVYSAKWHPNGKDWKLTTNNRAKERDESEESLHRRRRRWRKAGKQFWRHSRRHAYEPDLAVRLDIVDLPGSYSIISPTSEDELVTLRYIQQERPDVIVNVVDATNLARNLLLTLGLLEFDIPVIVCLNQIDLARRMGIEINIEELEALLGVPVIPTIAIQGKNLKPLLRTAAKRGLLESWKYQPRRMVFPNGIEAKFRALEQQLANMQLCPLNLPLRIIALQLLEEYVGCAQCVDSCLDQEALINLVNKIRDEIETEFDENVVLVLGEKRLDYATYITERVQAEKGKRIPLSEEISAVLTHRVFGLPIAVLILIGSLLLIFAVGALFDATIGEFWDLIINPTAEALIYTFIPSPIFRTIILYGLVYGLQGWLFVAIPFVATFYILLSIMEDTGYLARVAFLLDALMHRMGLHGRAIIPLLTGMGCNVPAVLGTRILNTKRERLIAGFLVVLVPCSAQLAVILGTVALYGSIIFAFIIYGMILTIIIGLGALLQHTLPGASHGLVMEIPPLRIPRPKPIIKKTWIRFKEFVYIALPMIIVGSAILGVLLEFGYLELIVAPLSPLVVGWLGLPPETAAAFIYGILRKELTVELLIILAGGSIATFMTIRQMFVFALVTTIYIPCIATIAVLAREYGWKFTLILAIVTLSIAFFLGGLVNWFLIGLGIP